MEKPTEYSPVIPPTQSTKPKIFISTKIHKSNHWLKEEDDLLLLLAQKYNEKSWIKVSLFFKNKNPAQCRARYKRIRPGIIKGSWSKEEDNSILQLVNKLGKNWSLIAKLVPTRNGKQIRDRFINYLDPEINRKKFTEEEDQKIIKLYIEYGSKWSIISKHFKGRTGDMIKNRFYSCLRRKVHGYEKNRKINKRSKKENCILNNELKTDNNNNKLLDNIQISENLTNNTSSTISSYDNNNNISSINYNQGINNIYNSLHYDNILYEFCKITQAFTQNNVYINNCATKVLSNVNTANKVINNLWFYQPENSIL